MKLRTLSIYERKMTTLHKAFVYGTLKSADEQDDFYIVGYDIYDAGAYPYIAKSHDSHRTVRGQLIEVDDEELAELDRYEGLSSGLYTREVETVREIGSDRQHEAYVYVAGERWPKVIANGRWGKSA